MKLKNLVLSVISAGLMVFSFPNFLEPGLTLRTSFFIWFAYVPLFFAIFREEKALSVVMYSCVTGLLFYTGGLFWLTAVKPMGIFAYVAWLALSVHLTAVLCAAAALAHFISSKFKISKILTFPVLFTLSDFVREWLFSGFPLLTPAQSQFQNIFLIQAAGVTGVYGIVFLILAVNAFLAMLLLKQKEQMLNKHGLIVLCLSLLVLVFSAYGYFAPDTAGRLKLKAAILQPDINQDVEWGSEYKKNVFAVFEQLSARAKKENADLVLWPESGYPGFLQQDATTAKMIAGWTGNRAYTLVGGDYYAKNGGDYLFYNSVFVIDPKGAVINRYDKRHLVPFGEYVPFEHVFTSVRKVVRRYGFNGFEFGKNIEPLNLGKYGAGALICYDALFPEISRETVKKGSGILAHLSYESWYGKGPASAQIFTNTVLRAVENKVYIVRSVASGISGIVSDKGRIIAATGLFKREMLTAEVYINEKKTFYTKYGDVFIYLLCLLIMSVIIMRVVKK